MPTKRPPKDINQLAKYVLDVATGDAKKIEPPKKNPNAQALSRLGANDLIISSAQTYFLRSILKGR